MRSFPSALLVLGACGSISNESTEIVMILPEAATNDVPVAVEITGAFPIVFTSDLDTGKHGGNTVSATIGVTKLLDVQRRDDMRITATVPNGIPAGLHDVTVTIGSRSAVLEDGYGVVGASLLAALTVPAQVASGATFTVRMTVENRGDTAATMAAPSALTFGGSNPILVTAATGGVTIPPDGMIDFTWTYQAGPPGSMSVQGTASAVDELTNIPVMSASTSTSTSVN